MAISIGSLQFDEQWPYKQLRKDLRDDWFPDPKAYCDMIDSGLLTRSVRDNFEKNQGRYVASKSIPFNLLKPNLERFLLRDCTLPIGLPGKTRDNTAACPRAWP